MNSKRNYPLLLGSQFLSAFGDNAILAIILGEILRRFLAGDIDATRQSLDNIYYTSLLFLPYVFLAPLAGYLNDRFSKTRWLLGGNAVKVVGSLMTMASVWWGGVWLSVGYVVVGIGACLYSPAKYGILPEILPRERLVKANGTVEMLTLVAILMGTIAGAVMADRLTDRDSYLVIVLIYGASLILNAFMSKTPSYPDEVHFRHSIKEFNDNLRDIVRHPRLIKILIGTSLFWICGAMMKMNFQPWGQQVLGYTKNTQIALLGLWLSIGVMIGSVLAGQIYKTGELHATRRFGFLLGGAVLLLGLVKWVVSSGLSNPTPLVIGILIVSGIFAGLFLIPLNAALQAESHQDKLGKTIATQNGLENLAMLAGSSFAWVNVSAGFDPSQLFLALAILVVIVVALLRIPVKSETEMKGVAE